MLFGKHINKYYKKYWYFFLIGIIALIAVDWIQLYMPEFLGNIVDLLSVDYVESTVIGDVLTMSLYIILIAFGMRTVSVTASIPPKNANTCTNPAGIIKRMAMAAPTHAPADTPKKSGDTSGFLKMP